ncbi:MAG: VWA domain-containing protein [Gammaproteobacteria bacterium]|nr:VWA domain-containing protein [Gammaproteobacteria bacterium]
MNLSDEQLKTLANSAPATPDAQRRRDNIEAALAAFDATPAAAEDTTQGLSRWQRLKSVFQQKRRMDMQEQKDFRGWLTPALATLLLVPVVGYVSWQSQRYDGSPRDVVTLAKPGETIGVRGTEYEAVDTSDAIALDDVVIAASPVAPAPVAELQAARAQAMEGRQRAEVARFESRAVAKMASGIAAADASFANENVVLWQPIGAEADRDRIQSTDSNPVKRVAEQPVSTFSIDVDTANYAFLRRQLNAGNLPAPDSVRIEELINYFPYAWPRPASAEQPFQATVNIMPAPWHNGRKLMHIAIQGYDIAPTTRPKANLVFLIDTSGSMNQTDKLPLLKNAFRLLLDTLQADDTVAIVTYAGNAGTALEPTRVADKRRILDVIDGLGAGGSTAGAAGIDQAYTLAERSFVEGGVNRVLLATDGDFNVGQTSDEDLKRIIENKRARGIYLSVFGFGQGNYNDQLMQVLAQNGNGTAAYIDTLSEAQKTLVQEAGSTLFPIANDVKIQVEFNPATVAEYRLIGYETRALAREDFNNDRVDAGDIGSGHSVTAIYELTPVGSGAVSVDELRYARAEPAAVPASDNEFNNEYAFVKIRYKRPGESTSNLITQPVTGGNELASLDAASTDQRFSIAVSAFGQKLRDEDAVHDYDWSAIQRLASGARGDDAFGYRAEFLRLATLAATLQSQNR